MGELVDDVFEERPCHGEAGVEAAYLAVSAASIVETHGQQDKTVHDLAEQLEVSRGVRVEGDRLPLSEEEIAEDMDIPLQGINIKRAVAEFVLKHGGRKDPPLCCSSLANPRSSGRSRGKKDPSPSSFMTIWQLSKIVSSAKTLGILAKSPFSVSMCWNILMMIE